MKVYIIADKPQMLKIGNNDPVSQTSLIPLGTFLFITMPDIVNKINHIFKGPKDKYPYSMTSSQVLGWYDCPMLNRQKYQFPKFDCDVTKYAADYVGLTGRSPFARKIQGSDKAAK